MTETPSFKVKNSHICVLICFNNFDHIVECFESLYNDNIDFFIIENYSPYSEKIKNYFLNKKLVGYIQFEKNITNNAVNTFINDYIDLLSNYEFITFSDCDLRIKNVTETFSEIKSLLDIDDIAVSCVDLELCNLPNIKNSTNWLPTPNKITDKYIEVRTGIHLMTFKNENIWIIKDVKFLDGMLFTRVIAKNKKWVKTIKNKAYHLTWDLYYENNDYFNYKKKLTHSELWLHDEKSDYKVLI